MPKRPLFHRLSLRSLLTLPYAALLLALVLLMGGLSWRAGRDTVDTLSGQLQRHVGGADAVLEAAFPTGAAAPDAGQDTKSLLRHADADTYARKQTQPDADPP